LVLVVEVGLLVKVVQVYKAQIHSSALLLLLLVAVEVLMVGQQMQEQAAAQVAVEQ
jgi:hypothetical protein